MFCIGDILILYVCVLIKKCFLGGGGEVIFCVLVREIWKFFLSDNSILYLKKKIFKGEECVEFFFFLIKFLYVICFC